MAEVGGGVLPQGYKRCKYLESSGTQYIDTGIIPRVTNIKSLICKFSDLFLGTNLYNDTPIVFGVYRVGYVREFWFGRYTTRLAFSTAPFTTESNYTIVKDLGGTDTSVNRTLTSTMQITYNNAQNVVFEEDDSRVVSPNSNTSWFVDNGTMRLFCVYDVLQKTERFFSKVKVHAFSITGFDNNPLLDYIPCLDADGIPCMYDTATQAPFYNRGVGTFGYELLDGTYVAPQ